MYYDESIEIDFELPDYIIENIENLIKAFDSSKNEPDSKVLQVACIVLDDELTEKTIKNIAAITSEKDKDGKDAKDRDSQPTEIDTNTYPENTNIQI